MVEFDAAHHEVAERLLTSLGFETVDSSVEDDFNSVADRYIMVGGHKEPVGLKKRGSNSGKDFNLTAWSHAKGDLPEFANAGGKLYLYRMKTEHILLCFESQEKMNTLLPEQWSPIQNKFGSWEWMNDYSGVRRSSEASGTQQGVVFVPAQYATILAKWDLNENLTWVDSAWAEVCPALSAYA